MFKKSLQTKLENIFDLERTTFDAPSESQEQECAFIEIDSSKNSIRDGREVAKVTGKIKVFGNSGHLPYGYFSKKISAAKVADTMGLFFYDIEMNAGVIPSMTSAGTVLNIVERTVSFVYLYDAQYDPEHGSLTTLNTSYSES